jgi:hypothetical protein
MAPHMVHDTDLFITDSGKAGLTGSFMKRPPHRARPVSAFNST